MWSLWTSFSVEARPWVLSNLSADRQARPMESLCGQESQLSAQALAAAKHLQLLGRTAEGHIRMPRLFVPISRTMRRRRSLAMGALSSPPSPSRQSKCCVWSAEMASVSGDGQRLPSVSERTLLTPTRRQRRGSARATSSRLASILTAEASARGEPEILMWMTG